MLHLPHIAFFLAVSPILGVCRNDELAFLRSQNNRDVLARLDLDHGNTTVKFLQPEDGEIVIVMEETVDGGLADSLEEEGNLNPTDIYIRLSGAAIEDVPIMLVEAEASMLHRVNQEMEDASNGKGILDPNNEEPTYEDDQDEGHRALCIGGGGIASFCSRFRRCVSYKGCRNL